MKQLLKKGLTLLLTFVMTAGLFAAVPQTVHADGFYDITASIPLVQLDRSANIIVTLKNTSAQPVSYIVYNALTQEFITSAVLAPDFVGHEFNLTSPRQENEILVVEMRDVTGTLVASKIVYQNFPYAMIPTTPSYPEPLVPVMVPIYSAPYTAYPIPAMPKAIWTVR